MNVNDILNDKTKTWSIFDREVSKSYDLISDLISLRLYRRWCRGLARALPSQPGLNILDLACGTGLIPMAIHEERSDVEDRYTCVDLSEEMLDIFRRKMSGSTLESQLNIQRGDATDLTLESDQYDVVTMA